MSGWEPIESWGLRSQTLLESVPCSDCFIHTRNQDAVMSGSDSPAQGLGEHRRSFSLLAASHRCTSQLPAKPAGRSCTRLQLPSSCTPRPPAPLAPWRRIWPHPERQDQPGNGTLPSSLAVKQEPGDHPTPSVAGACCGSPRSPERCPKRGSSPILSLQQMLAGSHAAPMPLTWRAAC